MREVIQSVLAAEAEAQGIVAAARAEVECISSGAQHRAQELLAQAQQESRGAAARIVEVAVTDATREKADRLECMSVEIEVGVELSDNFRERAVVAAVNCVCGLR